jgi:hypothetical protein
METLQSLTERVVAAELELAAEKGRRAELEKALESQQAVNHAVGRALVQLDSFIAHMASGGKIQHAPQRLKEMGVVDGPDVSFKMLIPKTGPVLADAFGNPLNGRIDPAKLQTDRPPDPPVGGAGPAGS